MNDLEISCIEYTRGDRICLLYDPLEDSSRTEIDGKIA